MKRRFIKPIALALLVTVTPALSGCFGSFGATRFVWEINRDLLPNKFLQWIVFWLFTGLQVYSIAVTIDVLVLNLLEFWTGSNMLVDKGEEVEEKVVQLEDGTIIAMNRNGYESLSFSVSSGGEFADFELEMERDGAVIREGGETVGLLQVTEDSVSIYDTEGQLLDAMNPGEQHEAMAAYESDGAAGLVGWHKNRRVVDYGIGMR